MRSFGHLPFATLPIRRDRVVFNVCRTDSRLLYEGDRCPNDNCFDLVATRRVIREPWLFVERYFDPRLGLYCQYEEVSLLGCRGCRGRPRVAFVLPAQQGRDCDRCGTPWQLQLICPHPRCQAGRPTAHRRPECPLCSGDPTNLLGALEDSDADLTPGDLGFQRVWRKHEIRRADFSEEIPRGDS